MTQNVKDNLQRGSAHAILPIILIVALIGALGFVGFKAWSNKDNSADAATLAPGGGTLQCSATFSNKNSAGRATVTLTVKNTSTTTKDFKVRVTKDPSAEVYNVFTSSVRLASKQSKTFSTVITPRGETFYAQAKVSTGSYVTCGQRNY